MAAETGLVSGQLRNDINVTPLIDVLLVLLIIFMVIVPVTSHGFNAMLPQRSAKPNPSLEIPIVVRIMSARDGLVSYRINQHEVAIDELGSRLREVLSVRANKVICIQGDDHLDFSIVARVMDIGRAAGVDHIGLMTSRDRLYTTFPPSQLRQSQKPL